MRQRTLTRMEERGQGPPSGPANVVNWHGCNVDDVITHSQVRKAGLAPALTPGNVNLKRYGNDEAPRGDCKPQ